MNKKLFKIAICGIPVILGCITACSAISSITSKEISSNDSLYNISSLNALFNFDGKKYVNFSLEPGKDYTNGNRKIPSGDPNYPKYIKEVTNDMFKEENLQKTKDFLAFSLISYNFFILYEQTAGIGTSYTVDDYNQLLKEMLKSFSLKVSPISNFQLHNFDGTYDVFSFSCTSKMEFLIQKDGKTKK